MIHSQVYVPLFGSISADMLVDFTNGSTIMYTPFLGLCERDTLGAQFNISDIFALLLSQDLGVTIYEGPLSAPWASNNTSQYKFRSHVVYNSTNFTAYSYFDSASGNAHWIHSVEQGMVMQFGS